MTSIFPDILFLGPYFAPVVVRMGVAVYFLLRAQALWPSNTKKTRLLAAKEALLGLLLAAGLLTQLVAALGILVILFRGLWLGNEGVKESWHEKLLAIAALASLIISGSGAFAFDLPY